MATPSSLPYHEPSLVSLLKPCTFLLGLNSINSVLDRSLACGLVGQVLVGTAWGVPGAGWLSLDFQKVVSDLGYLGLILVVYAGGLETDVAALRKNLVLSVAVAVTGVAVPIALSFAFLGPSGASSSSSSSSSSYSSLQVFAAGAALCSTSLGTTFSVLQASGLSRTRLGAVLASAALLDDVVGLVMVRIITALGKKGTSGIEPTTILRPVLVSLAFAVVVPVACHYVLKPGKPWVDRVLRGWSGKTNRCNGESETKRATVASGIRSMKSAFILQTALLILLIVAADYAGAAVLLAAYLAGVVVSWWDDDDDTDTDSSAGSAASSESQQDSQSPVPQRTEDDREVHNAAEVFDNFYGQVVHRVLKPFFFASIGFSIPISKLFARNTIWRGIIYSVLMVIGKLVCGLWLVVRVPIATGAHGQHRVPSPSAGSADPEPPKPPKPLSLYPASVVGCAMVARGEIGFLISSTAESEGVFRRPDEDASEASELFLTVTWAIFVCTILGPVCTGLLVRRIKKLEKTSEASRGGGRNVLGVWGVG